MADFSTPFGDDAERRLASASEKQNGFPCGPADQTLFSGLFYQLWAELDAIHQEGGVPGDDSVYNTTLLNIQALISAAIGNGDTSQFVLFSQARSRLPIYPEFLTSDGKINVTSPATGTVRLPSGVDFSHRGIFTITTTQIDFPTDASKTYHLRWSNVDGYELKDLASGTYNPSVYAETHQDFDSTFDDMLIARIITNSSNVATITNLSNKHELKNSGTEIGPNGTLSTYDHEDGVLPDDITEYTTVSLNWARTADTYLSAMNDVLVNDPGTRELSMGVRPLSRYNIAVWAQGDVDVSIKWSARS